MPDTVPQDQKKEEFKKYLDKAGVLELLTASLVKLYEEPEKPNDALEYLKNNIGGSKADKEEINKLASVNEELKKKVEELEKKESELKEKMEKMSVPKLADETRDMAEDAPAEPSTAAMEETPPIAEAALASEASDADAVPEKIKAAVEEAMETEDTSVATSSEPTIVTTETLAAAEEKADTTEEKADITEEKADITEEKADTTEEKADTVEPNASTEEKNADVLDTEAAEGPKDAES